MNKTSACFMMLGLLAGLCTFDLKAAEPEDTATDQTYDADLKEQNDGTILSRRVWSETEWNKFTSGRSLVEQTLGALWAWRLTDNQDFAIRLRVPAKFSVNDPNMSDIGGLGDIKLAAGTAFALKKNFRIGFGLDLEAPTGRAELSDNAWRLQEFGVMGWDITPWLTFSPSFEYNQSLSTEGNYPKIHFLETFVPVTFVLPHKWGISVGYENKVDFENDNYVTNRAKIGIGKELENMPLSFYIQAKRDFDSGEKEFQVNFVVTYFFRPKPLAPEPPLTK